jgi:hypothetical protein
MDTYIVLQERREEGYTLLLPSQRGWSLPGILWQGPASLRDALHNIGIRGAIHCSLPISSGPIHVVWANCEVGQRLNRSHAWIDIRDLDILGCTESVRRLLSLSIRFEQKRVVELPFVNQYD